MSVAAPVFSLRLTPGLHAACVHYADEAGISLQMWIQQALAQHVGTDALFVAAYEEMSGRRATHWPSLPEELT